jgi:ABC-type oligopeptide transport system substrate-binding subunit
MKRFTALTLVLLALLGLVLAGCGKGGSNAGLKVLNWTAPGEVTTMDSGKGYDTISWEQMEIFNEGLYKINAGNEPIPGLARALPTVSADGITLTIDLRDNIKFSNGERITAADFVYAFQRVADPATGSQSANRLTFVKNASAIIAGTQAPSTLGVRAVSDSRLEITLVAPNPYVNTELSSSLYAPVSRAFVESKGENYALSSENLLSSGPFVLEGWTGANISWKYVKNPHYWDAANIYFDEINVQVVKETATDRRFNTAKVETNRYTKAQYMQQLGQVFKSNEYVNLQFSNVSIKKAGRGGEIYGIQLKQDYFSASYGDTGYLFVMVDLNDAERPTIYVRTWQPEKDPDFGIYDISNF